ncbi:hypothetical protein HanXRQr2_Chr13g0613771 [Helianthus annuus]|uniref:Uncharacterized protein n=1 Tax=Helianthus annuus TaxID=4232 RepID=A0A251SY40_HELAN|nr:hypothetical protein HanXRQr2_Chr13g0613771 [Helianthus annuus]
MHMTHDYKAVPVALFTRFKYKDRQAMLFTLSLKWFFKVCIFSPELLFNKSNMELMHCLA